MAEFTNRTPNEADGHMHYTLLSRTGEALLSDVALAPVSPLLCEGTPWTAACANRLLSLDSVGAPHLNINGGTY